jgi:hypothetical protein
MATQIARPSEAEYPPFFRNYINQVIGDDLDMSLRAPMAQSLPIWQAFPQDRELYAYAEGKWTPRDILGHIIDTERIMQYRALAIARGEKQSLPGFDEDNYVKNANFTNRPISALFAELTVVRLATQLLFQHGISDADMMRTGTLNGRAITPRAIAWIIFGHELHHISILKERYLIS